MQNDNTVFPEYHTERIHRILCKNANPIADMETEAELSAVDCNAMTELAIPAALPAPKTLPIKSSRFFARLKQAVQPVVQKDEHGTLTLCVSHSALPTTKLIEQEVTRFWQQTGMLPSIIFLSLKRYKELTANGCIVNRSALIPYEAGVRDDIVLKRYYCA